MDSRAVHGRVQHALAWRRRSASMTCAFGRSRCSPRTSPGPTHHSHGPAASAATEELIGTIGLEPRHARSGRQRELLQNLGCY